MATGGQPERVEAYEPFFGLREAPFSLAPDPRFLFASASHSAALAQVAYALERREPVVVVTGEIGTGKTLLCRTVLQRLRQKTFLSVITDPLLERDDLLKQLLQDFGVISKDRTRLTVASRHELVETLRAFLASLSPIQAHAVVIIDEAQHLQPEVLEQVRLLSNIDDARGTLLQIILVGQKDLEPLLSHPALHQLQQRVSRRFALEPLNRDEVKQYIEHRLALARGGKTPSQIPGATELAQELAEWAGTKQGVEFTPDAIHAVSQLSRGVPRVINLLCDRALEQAYASRLRLIDSRLIHAAASAVFAGAPTAPAMPALPNTTARGTPVGSGASIRTALRSEPEGTGKIVQPADAAPRGVSAPARAAAAPPPAKYAALAASIVLASVAIWYGVRLIRPPTAKAPSSAGTSSEPRGSSPQPDRTPVGAEPAAPNAAPGVETPPAQAAAPPAATLGATATGGPFDIVVASFRTEARATSVAADVAALGLPIRHRASDGWQQVLAGPFSSRTDAEQAQQRLQRAGLTGTQIVSAAK